MGFINFALACLGVLLIALGRGGHFVDAECSFGFPSEFIILDAISEDAGQVGVELGTINATVDTELLETPTTESEYLALEFDGDKTVVISVGGRSLIDFMLEECGDDPEGPECIFVQAITVNCSDGGPKEFFVRFPVIDVNNQAPVFEGEPYSSDISLPWPARVPLNREPIVVTDADFNPEFTQLKFSTSRDDKVEVYDVRQVGRPYTYVIDVFLRDGQQLTSDESVIEIRATDDELAGTASLNLDIKTFNTLPPEFSSPFYSFVVDVPMSAGDDFEPEGSNGERGISAEDGDGGTNIQYSIGDAGDAVDLVSINADGHLGFNLDPDSTYFARRKNRVAVIEVIATEPDGSGLSSKSTLIVYFMLEVPTTTLPPDSTCPECEECSTTEAPGSTASCPEPTPCPDTTTASPEPCSTVEPPECTCQPCQTEATAATECPTTPAEECNCATSTTLDPPECATVTTAEPSTCPDCSCVTDATSTSTEGSTSTGFSISTSSNTLFTGSTATDEDTTTASYSCPTCATTEGTGTTESECPAHCSSTTIVVTECPITTCPTESPVTCPPPDIEPCPATEPPVECPATEPPVECPGPCDPCECDPCDGEPGDPCPATEPPVQCPPPDCPTTCPTPEECSGTGGLIAAIIVTSILFVASAGAAVYLILKLRRVPKNPFQDLQPASAEQQLGGGANPRFSLANSNLGSSQLKPTEFSSTTVSEAPVSVPHYEMLGSDGGLSSNYAVPGSSTSGVGPYEPTTPVASFPDSASEPLPVIQEAPRVAAEPPAAKIPRPDYALVGFKDTVEIINADEMAYDESEEDERL